MEKNNFRLSHTWNRSLNLWFLDSKSIEMSLMFQYIAISEPNKSIKTDTSGILAVMSGRGGEDLTYFPFNFPQTSNLKKTVHESDLILKSVFAN